MAPIIQTNFDCSKITIWYVFIHTEMYGVDVIIMSEPNKKLAQKYGWHVGKKTDAAIVMVNKTITVTKKGKRKAFAWIELNNIVTYSCYCSPNAGIEHFIKFLTNG